MSDLISNEQICTFVIVKAQSARLAYYNISHMDTLPIHVHFHKQICNTFILPMHVQLYNRYVTRQRFLQMNTLNIYMLLMQLLEAWLIYHVGIMANSSHCQAAIIQTYGYSCNQLLWLQYHMFSFLFIDNLIGSYNFNS